MKIKDLNLKEQLEFNPGEGVLELGSQRMVIMPADTIGRLIEFIMSIADENMVYMFMRDMGEEAGRRDAQTLKNDFHPDTDMDWIGLGPTIHSWEGIVKASMKEIEMDRDEGHYYMKGDWEKSFIADQWLERFGESEEPVCSFLTGYAQGYASEVFGQEIDVREPLCRAKGDDRCMFEGKVKGKWEEE
jgi:predicted hydrocarbon binding protein